MMPHLTSQVMPQQQFDAIVVGARVAGAATAFQLARRGWRVALVEKQVLPLGPVLSLPVTYPRGQAQFAAVGLLAPFQAAAEGLHRIRSIQLRFDDTLVLRGELPAWGGFDHAVIVPRERLDNALLTFVLQQHYPVPGGVMLFAGHRVVELVRADGEELGPARGVRAATRTTAALRELTAPLVIGADGRLSRVAALLDEEAQRYDVVEPVTSFCYSMCRGVEAAGLPDVLFARAGSNRMLVFTEIATDLQVVGVYLPSAEYDAFHGQRQRHSREATQGALRATWERVPELAGRMSHVELLGAVLGLDPRTGAGFFRPPGGPGWALVGDAAHFQDPAAGQGLHDALATVAALIGALDRLNDGHPLSEAVAMRQWPDAARRLQRERDHALGPMYAFTNSLSRLLTKPPNRWEATILRGLGEDPAFLARFLGISTGATDFTTFQRALPRTMALRAMARLVQRARQG